MALKVGDKAFDFSLLDDKGQKVSLKDFRGKKVVLYFYPKDLTPGCSQEAQDFNQHLSRFKCRGVVVLGVSVDSVQRHQKFRDKYGLKFPLLSDESKEVVKKYGVWKQKTLYGKKFWGIERTTFVIDEKGKVQHIFPKVKVKGHVEEVLKVL